MGIIRKPSELAIKPTLAILVYGQPGIGKTTLACSAQNPVLIDCDGGATRINGAHMVDTVQVEKWEDVDEALKEITTSNDYQTIVIDTCGKLLAYMEAFIKSNDPKKSFSDRSGGLTLKGYGMRKQMFLDFIKRIRMSGRSLVFVAHEQEQKRGDETVLRPEVGGSSVNDLIKELDLVGYMEALGDGEQMIRTISFNPSSRFYAKNTCNLQPVIKLPVTVNADGSPVGNNNLLSLIILDYFKKRKGDQEKVRDYEELLNIIDAKIECVTDANTANEVIAFIKSMNHIFNSKEIASQRISRKAKKIGIVYNKVSDCYE